MRTLCRIENANVANLGQYKQLDVYSKPNFSQITVYSERVCRVGIGSKQKADVLMLDVAYIPSFF